VPATLHLSTSVRLPAAENPAPAPRRTSPYRRLVAPAARAAVVAAGTATAALALLLPVAPAAPAALAAPAPTPVVTAPVVAAPIELAAVAAPAAVPVAPAATRASALQNAMSKIGSPYRYGAAGPVAFDCSGLVNWAYKAAGVALPRTSRQLSTIGTPVAKADLQPGDLVFFYRPISHVAIYIGDGKVVHASNRRDPVKISNLAAMPFTAARRV
jgi:cell wall-associated NlpC family hydrolase